MTEMQIQHIITSIMMSGTEEDLYEFLSTLCKNDLIIAKNLLKKHVDLHKSNSNGVTLNNPYVNTINNNLMFGVNGYQYCVMLTDNIKPVKQILSTNPKKKLRISM